MLKRGQSAVELLIVLALSFAVLAVIVGLSYSQLSVARSSFYASQAQASLNSLVEAGNTACGEGTGSRRIVSVIIPPTVVSSRVFVDGNIANIGLAVENGTTDVNVRSEHPLQGRLPNASGEYSVPVECRERFVFIGYQDLEARPSLVHAFISPSSSLDRNVTVSNKGNATLSVSCVLSWSGTGATAIVSPAGFSLPAGASENVTVSFVSGAGFGSFGGRLNISADNGEEAAVDILLDVVS